MKGERHKYGNQPPLSTRICVPCGCIRKFKYSKKYGHSVCIVCNSRWARDPLRSVR